MTDLQEVVAHSADAADLHAPVATLLLELTSLLGSLTSTVTAATERGRIPFRPDAAWTARLGDLAYGVYLLADQTGVQVDAAVTATASNLHRLMRQREQTEPADWPFKEN